MASIQQTIVLITGANQGLGLECVKKLAREQANFTLLLASRNLKNGEEAAKQVTGLADGTVVEPIQLDVNSDSSIEQAAEAVKAKYGRLDVLFNNAGISSAKADSFRAEFNQILDTNVVGAACVTEAFLPLLKNAAHPRLLFMSSSLGSVTLSLDPKYPAYGLILKPYNTSKCAMNMLGMQYAVQLGKEGFKVNVVDPGYRPTNLSGYMGSNVEEGAWAACKLIVNTDKDGPHESFESNEGIHPW